MRKSILLALTVGISISSVACSSLDSGLTRLGNNFGKADTSYKCYSGGVLIASGQTDGKPISESKSDGYYFRDKATGKFVEGSADCMFIYGE